MRKLLLVIAVVVGLVCGGSVSADVNTYYVPYFSNENGTACGVALANYSEETNAVELEYYSWSGTRVDVEEKTLLAHNQTAFVPSLQASTTGWIKIKAPYPVCGLALIFNDTTMLDLDFKESLHTKFIIPQVAANGTTWDSILMMCNPNNSETTITLTYFPPTALDVYEELSGTITKIMSTTEYDRNPNAVCCLYNCGALSAEEILCASSGVGPLVVFSTAHGLETGQRVSIDMPVGLTLIDSNVYSVTVLDDDHFSLDGTAPIDGFPFESEGSWITYREEPAPREDPTGESIVILKNGSTTIDLREVFNKTLNGGYLHISSPESIAAFITYNGLISGENNWKAGLSAVPIPSGELSDRGIGGEEISGTYDGITNQGPFGTDSTNTAITVDGHTINIILDAFFSGECRLNGTVADDYSSASGTYQCSNFTSGSWSSQNLNLLRTGVLYGEIILGGSEVVVFGLE